MIDFERLRCGRVLSDVVSRVLAGGVLVVASPALAADVPSGLFAGLSNKENTASAELAVAQDGLNFTVVYESDSTDVANLLPVTLNSGMSFGSEEENGVFGISGSASASSVAGILRASASVTVTDNTVSDFSVPFLTENEENENGIPTFAGFSAFASFTDELQYGGTATNYTSRYLLRLTGSISDFGGFVVVTVTHGGGSSQAYVFDQVGTFNELIATDAFIHGGSPQTFEVRIQATADANSEFDYEGRSFSANFSNTLEVLALELRDADSGELLTGETITTFGGATLPVTLVPEPGTAAIAGIGVLLLMNRRRRRA